VSAVTWNVFDMMGLVTPALEAEIVGNLHGNLRGDWNKSHTRNETLFLFFEQKDRAWVKCIAKKIARYLEDTFGYPP
jgi:hypothetical protein